MSRNQSLAAALTFACACVSLLPTGGCRGRADLPPMAKTTGRVTLDGEPLAGGEVVFVPDALKGNTGPVGIGAIGEDGTYEIRTVGRSGALVGWHKIRVVAIDETKPEKPWLIPIEYGYEDKSGLAAEVKPNQENVIPLELKSRR